MGCFYFDICDNKLNRVGVWAAGLMSVWAQGNYSGRFSKNWQNNWSINNHSLQPQRGRSTVNALGNST